MRRRLALVVSLATIVVSGVGRAAAFVELGELQAVSMGGPPHVFRVLLSLSPDEPPHVPAVIVRRPPDVLSFVTSNALELHLRTLAEVEVEISVGGQTLNRLFPLAELQAARARLQARLARERHRSARANGEEPARSASLPHEVRRTHQRGGQVDPIAVRQALSSLEPAQDELVSAGANQVASAVRPPPWRQGQPSSPAVASAEPMRREGAVRLLHAEAQRLVGQAVPWTAGSPARPQGEAAPTPLVGMALGGLCGAGLASLFTGMLMRHRAFYRQRQRPRRIAAMPAGLSQPWPRTPAPMARPTTSAPSPARAEAEWPPPSAVRPRLLRVLYRERRRIRIRAAPYTPTPPRRPAPASSHRRLPAADDGGPPSTALLEALSDLRRALNRQRRLSPASPAAGTEGDRARRCHEPGAAG